MQRMSGGQAVIASLKSEGVEHVFGIVGTHNAALFDGAYADPEIEVVTVRHEQGATLMATGYARASGKIAACFVVPGPGVTNALTGMGMAYSESAPVLVIAGQNPASQLDHEGDYFHELPNSLSVAGSLCGFTHRVNSVAEIPRSIHKAMHAMRCRRPRPAYIEIPLNLQTEQAEVATFDRENYPHANVDVASLLKAVDMLNSASRPFIFAGGGVATANASMYLVELAELLGAPVVTSVYARGVISDRHPLALGDGWGRLNIYDELLEQADLVLVVGSRLENVSDFYLGSRMPKQMIQIDIDARVLGRRRQIDVGLLGDAGVILSNLKEALVETKHHSCWFDTHGFRQRKHLKLQERAAPILDLILELRNSVPDNTIFVDDLTLVGYWMPILMPTYQPRTLIHPGTFGTLGYALPAAIGAKLACPDQPVIAISGDGGFLFTLQELSTAVALKLDLIVLIFNDNAFGAIQTYQDQVHHGRRIGSDLMNPDFVKLGESFGANSIRVDLKSLSSTVRRTIDQGGVWLIEIELKIEGPAKRVPWMP